MIAINKKTNHKYDVIGYTVKVKERGSDTTMGKPKMVLYSPRTRNQFDADRDEFFIVDNFEVSGQNAYHSELDFQWKFNGNKPLEYPKS